MDEEYEEKVAEWKKHEDKKVLYLIKKYNLWSYPLVVRRINDLGGLAPYKMMLTKMNYVRSLADIDLDFYFWLYLKIEFKDEAEEDTLLFGLTKAVLISGYAYDEFFDLEKVEDEAYGIAQKEINDFFQLITLR
jgi:hypothetical protein